MLTLLEQTPPNVYLCRRKSAWNNSKLMVDIVTLLGRHLAHLLDEYYIILSLDGASLHCTSEVVAAVERAGLQYMALPARLTWLLQPCDTHLFVLFKRFLKKAHMKLRTEIAEDKIDMENFLKLVYAALKYVVQGNKWKTFLDDGFGADQEEVSSFIRRSLNWTDASFPLIDALPTQESILAIWPKNKPLPYNLIFRKYLRVAGQVALRLPADRVSFAVVSARVRRMRPHRPPTAAASTASSSAPALPAGQRLLALPAPAAEWQPTAGPVTRSQTRLERELSQQSQRLSPPRGRSPAAQPQAAPPRPRGRLRCRVIGAQQRLAGVAQAARRAASEPRSGEKEAHQQHQARQKGGGTLEEEGDVAELQGPLRDHRDENAISQAVAGEESEGGEKKERSC